MEYHPAPFTTLAPGSTCASTLLQGASCNIVLTLHAPTTPGGLLLEPLVVCGFNNGVVCSTANRANRIQLNILDAAQGHFVFREGAADITNLDLAPNDTGTVTLHNTGGLIISGYGLSIPPAVISYFSGSCTTVTSLAAGASCNLSYAIPAVPVSGIHNIIATGSNADNSPHTLVVNTISNKVLITDALLDQVRRCDVNLNTAAFSGCSNTGASGFSNPHAIILNAVGTRAFVTDATLDQVRRCDVNVTTGAFNNCSNTGATGLGNPIGLLVVEP